MEIFSEVCTVRGFGNLSNSIDMISHKLDLIFLILRPKFGCYFLTFSLLLYLYYKNQYNFAQVQYSCFITFFSLEMLLWLIAFSIWVFFHEYLQFTRQQGKWECIYLTPLYYFHPLRHYPSNYCRELTSAYI